MKGFWVRAGSLAAVVCVLLVYNNVLAAREKDEEIAQMNARVEALEEYIQASQEEAEESDGADRDGRYTDGEWEGEAQGFGGPVSLKVTVESGKLSNIEILSAEKEDQTYLSMAKAMLPAMIKAQSADVDTISGATFSSEGIRQAAEQALEKAEK